MNKVYHTITNAMLQGKQELAVLIDPDFATEDHLRLLLSDNNQSHINYIFIGGSMIHSGSIHETVGLVKTLTELPIILFPGSIQQISSAADALLLLSLVSGRNPEMLIGKHVESAFQLKKSELELLSTAYILVDGGKETTVSYISGTTPIPQDKPLIAAATALAATQLGQKLVYMDAGSGADSPVPSTMIEQVRRAVDAPIIVGGGIHTAQGVKEAWKAGANIVVIGNALEKDPNLLKQLR